MQCGRDRPGPCRDRPRRSTQNQNMLRYLPPLLRGIDPALLPRMKRMMNHRAGKSGVSIVMPVYNTPRHLADRGAGERAHAMVRPVGADLRQRLLHPCHMWRRCWQAYRQARSAHPRVQFAAESGDRASDQSGLAGGVGRNTSTFMDHDDLLEPDAVYFLLRTAAADAGGFHLFRRGHHGREHRQHRRREGAARNFPTTIICRTRISCTCFACAASLPTRWAAGTRR